METGEDQLELARIGIDIAYRKQAGNTRFEGAGVGRDQLVLHFQAPVRHWTELHGEAEATFEEAGIEFIDENGGGPGVRLRKRQRVKKPK